MRRLLVPLALVVCALLPGAARAAPPFPGGLLDSTGRTAYLAGPVGIEAIDLARGERVWRSGEAHLPVLVAGDRLYALQLTPGHRFSVVALDLVSRAERVFRTEVTTLPRWVVTAERPGHSFHCTWRLAGRTLTLDWHATARSSGPAKQASGQVQIDLESGQVRTEDAALLTPRPSERSPAPLEKLAVRWRGQTGDQFSAVVLEQLAGPGVDPRATLSGPRLQRLTLRVWDLRSGKDAPPRELLRGQRLVVLPGLEGHHLWLRDAVPYPVDPAATSLTAEHHWSVVSVFDGHLVARVPYVPGTHVATLIERRAYCLATVLARDPGAGTSARTRTLHALDLSTGKQLWQRPLGGARLLERTAAAGPR